MLQYMLQVDLNIASNHQLQNTITMIEMKEVVDRVRGFRV